MTETAHRYAVEPRRKATRYTVRLLSAVVLLLVASLAVYLGGWVFTAVVAISGLIMSWEWGRMVRGTTFDSATLAQSLALLAAVVAASQSWPLPQLLAPIVGAAVVGALSRTRTPLSMLGAFVIVAASSTLIAMREPHILGFQSVLFVLICVWATDTFAMLTGKTIGGPRLSPQWSPQKTWAGAIGGFVASCLLAALFATVYADGSWSHGALVGGVLSVAAQIGDLLESGVKRTCGVKNTSELIPGHGGALDRMDGLICAVLAAWPLGLLFNPADPIRGLLLGN